MDTTREATIVWERVLKKLEKDLSKLMIDTWLRPTFPLRLTETTLEIGTDKETVKEWITARYLPVITCAVHDVANKPLDVIVTYTEERPTNTDTSSENMIDVVDKLQATKVWENSLKRIELELSKSEFDTLLRRTFPLKLTETTLEIGTPMHFIKHFIESKYLTIIKSAVLEVTNRHLDVVFIRVDDEESTTDNICENIVKKRINVSCERQITIPIEFYKMLDISCEVDCYVQDGSLIIEPIRPEYSREVAEEFLKTLIAQGLSGEELLSKFREMNKMIRPITEASNTYTEAIALTTNEQENYHDVTNELNSKYTFDSIIVGSHNQMAYQIANDLAKKDDNKLQLVYFYGEDGLGKTHLVQAIGNYLLQSEPDIKIRYISLDDFTNKAIDAVADGNPENFRESFFNYNVIIFDNLDFLKNKVYTQGEFNQILSFVLNSDTQVIITCTETPQEMIIDKAKFSGLFQFNAICEITQPDFNTKVAIVKQKIDVEKIELSDEAIADIAKKEHRNIRDLINDTNRVIAFVKTYGELSTMII